MALFKRKEWQERCGIESRGYLATYISRGKIILDANGMIDDANEINKSFYEARKDKAEDKQKTKKETVKVEEPKGEGEEQKTTRNKIDPESAQKKFEIGTQISEADLKKKAVDIELAELKIQKLRGELIPTDMVRLTFTTAFKNISTTTKNNMESILTDFAMRFKLSIDQVAEFRGKIISGINKSVNDAVDKSKLDMANIVEEYSQRKGVGERER